MEEIIKTPITKEKIEHRFTCDICGKEIGISTEYDDGYYENIGSYEQSIYVCGVWYKYKKTLCKSCQNVITSKMIMALKDIGFEPEKL